ncbi:MAG: sulfite exporter TauE/SafE family protein [Patescibacteria group bacterium]|nr:sulfite exporter TauE/SafE family protein [Patescibacteria group bacterium]
MHKKQIPIRGMHCRSCEILIERELKKIPGVSFVGVSFKKGLAEIHSQESIPDDLIYKAIAEAGYSVGKNEKKSWISRDSKQYEDLFSAFILLVALYLILKMLGLTDISINVGKPSSLLLVLLVGLTAGISTCMALSGGLIAGISARHAEKHPEATAFQKFRPHIFFNIGRIASYTVLGGIIGMIGRVFQFNGVTLGVITLLVAIIMLVLGLQLIEIFPKISNLSFSLPTGIAKFFGIKKHEKEYSHKNATLIGALTFFLPCGFTQAMQVYAMSSGNYTTGALIMGIFAIGTMPGLLGIGGLTSVIRGSFSKKFFKLIGLIVISLAIFNLINSFNLLGLKIPLPTNNVGQNNNVQDNGFTPPTGGENGVQVVRMTEKSNGYSPNSFTIKKGVPVKWIIDATNIYSCASSIVSRDLNISTTLQSGENVIEFTPQKTGTISFTCSMGMYRGVFTVTE